MIPSRPAHHDLARWLLEGEIAASKGALSLGDAAERLCKNFRRQLAPLVTEAGSQAFLARSLQLARVEFPFLDRIRAGPSTDPCFEGMAEALQDVDIALALDGLVAVFRNMIGLLVTFIGEDLTMHRIRNISPDARPRQTRGEVDRA